MTGSSGSGWRTALDGAVGPRPSSLGSRSHFGVISVAFFASTALYSAANAQASPGPSAASASGSASSAAANQLTEIVVTAQRRSENLQNVPISVTAVGGSELQKSGVSSVADLSALAPSLNFAQEAAWSEPHLRGIGTTATGPGIESPVAVYVDGVYYASMVGGAQDFNNVEAVEVINGPQGTLFGRNATGGLIQIRTKDPSKTFGGSASVGYGNYDTVSSSAYITGGLTDTLAADLAVDFRHQGDGFGRNLYDGSQVDYASDLFLRSKLLYRPNGDMKFTLALDYGHENFNPALQPAPGTQPVGGAPTDIKPHYLDGVYDPYGLINEGGVSLTADFDLHPIRLLSITAYRVTDSKQAEDGSLTPDPAYAENIFLDEPHQQVSQEIQLSSPSQEAFTWTAGAYYFHEVAKYSPTRLYGGLFEPAADIYYYSRFDTDSGSLYGQGTLALQPTTHFTAGIRYTVEHRTADLYNPVFGDGGVDFGATSSTGARTFSAPTWRLSLDHNFSNDILGYVSYNRGFKSGGFNPAILPTASYAPERLDAYEIGVKTQEFDRRVRVNVSGFYYDYQNIQVQSFAMGILDITNGAKAQLYGSDIDADILVTRNLTLHLGLELLHTEFTSYPNADFTTPIPGGGTAYSFASAKGHPIPLAPSQTATVALNYTIPSAVGDFKLNGAYNYNSGWNAEPDGRLKQGAYNVLNSQIAWVVQGGRYEIDLWAKNLLDQDYAVALISQSQGDDTEYAPPRTYGFTLRTTF